MQIELRPHIGYDPALNRDVDMGQDRIFVGGYAIGFVGRTRDANIMLTESAPSAAAELGIIQAVQQKYGGDQVTLHQPPPEPRPDLLADDDEDYEDDEDDDELD